MIILSGVAGPRHRQAGQCDACRDADSVSVRRGEEGAEPKDVALNLLVDLPSYAHLWSPAVCRDRKNKVLDASSRGEFPL